MRGSRKHTGSVPVPKSGKRPSYKEATLRGLRKAAKANLTESRLNKR